MTEGNGPAGAQAQAVVPRGEAPQELAQLGIKVPGMEGTVSLATLMELGALLADSDMFPNVKKQAQAVARILAGQELGFPPIYSLRNITVVQGKVYIGAEAVATLIKRSGRYDWKLKRLTDEEAVVGFYDNGHLALESAFTMAEARRAGLLRPDSGWAKWPKNMLFARAITQGARLVCPHLLSGAEPQEEAGLEEVEGRVVVQGATPPEGYAAFWGHCRRLGFEKDEVHSLLGVASLKDWQDTGKSLEDALAVLRRVAAEQDTALWDEQGGSPSPPVAGAPQSEPPAVEETHSAPAAAPPEPPRQASTMPPGVEHDPEAMAAPQQAGLFSQRPQDSPASGDPLAAIIEKRAELHRLLLERFSKEENLHKWAKARYGVDLLANIPADKLDEAIEAARQ
jgi:hypothetical protein